MEKEKLLEVQNFIDETSMVVSKNVALLTPHMKTLELSIASLLFFVSIGNYERCLYEMGQTKKIIETNL